MIEEMEEERVKKKDVSDREGIFKSKKYGGWE